MKKILVTLVGFFALSLNATSYAQTVPLQAQVVASCGTPASTYTAGQNRPLTMDANGNLCLGGTISPSGAAGGDLGGTYPNPTVVSVAHVVTGVLGAANGGTGLTAFTRAGNTTSFGTTTGSLTNGHCVSIDGNGNFVDAGGACTTGGGGGTVSAGSAGQLTYYAASGDTVSGNANATISAGALTLGQATSVLGSLKLSGSTSGTTTIVPNVAASGTLTLPAATDTLVGKATTDTLTNKSISGSTNTLTNIANASLTNSATTVNGQTCTLGSTCTVTAAATAITVASTTVGSGTTTRILYDNAGTLGEYTLTGSGTVVVMATGPTIASPTVTGAFTATGLVTNADLANSATTVNGQTCTLGSTCTVASVATATNLAGGTAGALAYQTGVGATGFISAVATGSVLLSAGTSTVPAWGALPLTAMATQATNTVVGNATSGSAAPTALSVGTCSTAGSALIWTTNTGFGCNTSITAAAVPASGLTGSTLASGVTASSLTSVGTLTGLTVSTAAVPSISNSGSNEVLVLKSTASVHGAYMAMQANGADIGYIGDSQPFIGGSADDLIVVGNTGSNLWLGANNTSQVELTTSLLILTGVGIEAAGTTPTLTGTCTTGSKVGGSTGGSFTATCTAQTVIIALPTAAHGWVCNAQDQTTSTDTMKQTANATNSCTLTGTTVAADVIVWNATAY